GDLAVGRRLVARFGEIADGEQSVLVERIGIEQRVDALARGKPALLLLARDLLFAAHRLRARFARGELLHGIRLLHPQPGLMSLYISTMALRARTSLAAMREAFSTMPATLLASAMPIDSAASACDWVICLMPWPCSWPHAAIA